MVDDVRVAEEGAADYGTRGRYDPPKLWFPCSYSCSVCCVRARGTEVDTSAGALSEAKTQRRPRSARERVRGGVSFVVSLFLYLSFSRARKRHLGVTTTRRGDEKGEARRWCKKATA